MLVQFSLSFEASAPFVGRPWTEQFRVQANCESGKMPEILELCDDRRHDEIGANNFDFCRFCLAVMVIFSHSYALAEGDESNEPLAIITGGQIGSGHLAVCGFFAISGFLITHSWLRSRSVSSYLMKRVLRIYPGFIAAVLIGVFVIAPLGSTQYQLTTRELLLLPMNLAILQRSEPSGVFANNPWPKSINGSLWSIPYEFKCYLGLMFMGALGLLKNRQNLTLFLLVVFALGNFFYPFVLIRSLERGAFAAIIGVASRWVEILAYFLAGTTFYLFRHRILFTPPWVAAAVLAVFAASFFPPAGRLVYPIATPYLLFWFSLHSPVHLERWGRYGDFSYGIYLYAYPIQQLIVMRFPAISPMTLFIIATPLAIIAGICSWHLIEKRFLKMKYQQSRHATLTGAAQ